MYQSRERERQNCINMKVAAEKLFIQHFAIIEWINIIIWLIVVIVTHTTSSTQKQRRMSNIFVVNGGLYADCSSMLNALWKDVVLLLCCELHVELFMFALKTKSKCVARGFFFFLCHSSTVIVSEAVAVVTVSICPTRSNYIIMLVRFVRFWCIARVFFRWIYFTDCSRVPFELNILMALWLISMTVVVVF